MADGSIVPCLWFDGAAEEAATFYVEVFGDGRILDVSRFNEAGHGTPGTAMFVSFELRGQRFGAINGGPQYSFTPAVSFQIDCADQEEVDYFWGRLTEAGAEGPCGWCTDRYGVSWQVVPRQLGELLSDPDPGRAQRATAAMLRMKKLDLAALRAAADSA